MKRQEQDVDLEGVFFLNLAGRETAVSSGYRPQHAVYENYETSGEHTYLDCDVVNPGCSRRVAVRFITPEVYPRCLWEGRVLAVYEGSRLVGELKVTRIVNQALAVSPEAFSARWIPPVRPPIGA